MSDTPVSPFTLDTTWSRRSVRRHLGLSRKQMRHYCNERFGFGARLTWRQIYDIRRAHGEWMLLPFRVGPASAVSEVRPGPTQTVDQDHAPAFTHDAGGAT